MSRDDQRTPAPDGETAQGAGDGASGRDEATGDDLESLAGALPAQSAGDSAHPEADEELDLGGLAAVGGPRPASQLEEGDRAPVSLAGNHAPAGAPAMGGRAPWLLPLLIGLGLGAGAAATVFMAGVGSDPAASAASSQGAAAPSSARPVPGPVAGPAEATARTPAAEPAQAAIAADTVRAPSAEAAAPAPAAPGSDRPEAAAPAPAARAPAEAIARRSDSLPRAATPGPNAAGTGQGELEFGSDPLADESPPPDKAAAPADASAKSAASMDALLDEALSPAARRAELERRQQLALAAQELPLTPSREDVTQAMTVLLPAIRGCAQGQSGLATAGIVVRNDGRVADVEITGAPFAGTASGRCMEGVIRRARFTRFRQPILRVKFPLAIQ